jgi:hypothetical protein
MVRVRQKNLCCACAPLAMPASAQSFLEGVSINDAMNTGETCIASQHGSEIDTTAAGRLPASGSTPTL